MSESAVPKVLRAVSLLFTGLFAGFLLGVLVLEASLRGYDASVYTKVRQVELDSLDTLASVTLIPALVSTLVVAVPALRARGNDRWLVLAALVLLVLVFVTTLAVNLPINSEQVKWSVQAPPSDWAGLRDRWQLAHLARTVFAVLAFCSLTGATITRSSRRRRSADQVAMRSGVPTSRTP
jgi:Na+-driven multidrug efflux pump